MVCNTENEGCMLRKCSMCSTTEHIEQELFEATLTLEDINFCEWSRTDGTKLVHRILPKEQFVDDCHGWPVATPLGHR